MTELNAVTWNQRLTAAREQKGLSKTAFWRLVGVSSATATNWENGIVQSIKGEHLVNVCRVLGVTEDWLLNGGDIQVTANDPSTPAESRRANLADWFKTRAIPPKEKSYISQLLSSKSPFGEKAARRLESALGMEEYYLDRSPEENERYSPAILSVIKMMMAVDERGQQRIHLAAQDAYEMHLAHQARVKISSDESGK